MGVDKLQKALHQLEGQESVPQSHIDLYRKIFKAQSRAKRIISPKGPRIARKDLEKRFEEGLPLLRSEKAKIPARGLAGLFRDICSALKKYNKANASDIEVLEGAKAKKKLDLEELVRSAAFGDRKYCREIAERFMLRYELLLFLGLALGRPVFEVWAEKLRSKVKDDGWLRSYCPICGSEPYMARLHREDGRRLLGCPLCGTEWTFARIECPFCLNKDQKSLRYFFVDEESPYRVDVCEKCKRYVKTVDERKREGVETFLLVEDIATAFLDVLAEREGYVRAEASSAA